MNQEQAMRARVAGREALAARTVWQVEVRGLRARCVAREGSGPGDKYEVHLRHSKGWKAVEGGTGDDPYALLVKLIGSGTIQKTCGRS